MKILITALPIDSYSNINKSNNIAGDAYSVSEFRLPKSCCCIVLLAGDVYGVSEFRLPKS